MVVPDGPVAWSVVLDTCDARGELPDRLLEPGEALEVDARSVVLCCRPHDA